MITRRTKIQLIFFVIITLVGVAFVGARYAQLDRVIVDDAYTVVAHFQDSGGIFAGGEVTYRGVRIGQVEQARAHRLRASTSTSTSTTTTTRSRPTRWRIVGNRSAVGEQYVELQPQTDDKPYLEDEAEIPVENTELPIQTDTLLTDISNTVESVDRDALRTTVDELGRPSPAPARTCRRSSTPATPSSRPPTRTSTSPPP